MSGIGNMAFSGQVRRTVLAAAATLLLCAALTSAALALSTDFSEPASSPEPAGVEPQAVAAADLDGDSDQDLAVANTADQVTILRNAGSGDFSQPASSPEAAGDIPASVAAADLDGDSDQDLAVANRFSGDVTILRNTGSGNFKQPASSPEAAGPGAASVVAADLDGDSDQDLAVANRDSNDVTILRNTGSGNFRQPATSPEGVGDFPVSVAAADLDGDSDQDLAVVHQFGGATILRNTGSGNFREQSSSPEPTSAFPTAVTAVDLDADSDQDLAVASGSDEVTILRNTGSGNFREPASSPEAAGDLPISIVAADFDGDTDQDLAVANQNSANVTILRNTGSGNFNQPATSPEAAHSATTAITAADLDGDLDEDLAVANVASNDLTILLNN